MQSNTRSSPCSSTGTPLAEGSLNFEFTSISYSNATFLTEVLPGIPKGSGVYMIFDTRGQLIVLDKTSNLFHRLEIAAAAQHHFDEMRYWMTDLSVSLLTLSERRAREARTQLEADLGRIAAFAPGVAASIRDEAAAYFDLALQAADAYTEERRVIGNSHLAAARTHSDKVGAALSTLIGQLERVFLEPNTVSGLRRESPCSGLFRCFAHRLRP